MIPLCRNRAYNYLELRNIPSKSENGSNIKFDAHTREKLNDNKVESIEDACSEFFKAME